MVEIKIEIVTTDRAGHVKQRATLSSEEFIQLKNQINNITQDVPAITERENESKDYLNAILFGKTILNNKI